VTWRANRAISATWTEHDVEAVAEATMTGRLVDPEVMTRLGPTPPDDYLRAVATRVRELVELETWLADVPARLVGVLAVIGMSDLNLDELTVQLRSLSDEDRITCNWVGLLDNDHATELGRRVCHVAALMSVREE
jgi:hypothetical protein